MDLWTGLAGMMLVVVVAIAVAVQTGVLASSIWILSNDDNNPFTNDGQLVTWGKCAGIVVVYYVLLVVLAPLAGCFGLLLTMGAWFLAIMMLFERSFGEAFLIFLANIVISMGVNWGLGKAFGV